jgi:hypothetical protein
MLTSTYYYMTASTSPDTATVQHATAFVAAIIALELNTYSPH